MRSSFKRSFLPVLLAMVFVLANFSPLAANSFGNFTVDLKSDANSTVLLNADLSDVKVDVYESALDRYDPSADAYVYAHEYSHSVYTNSKGSVTFAKPSARFLVKIDVATLPNGLGIEKTTVFYNEVLQKNDSYAVSDIADFKISSDSSLENGVRVEIFNAYGQTIKAGYTVTPAPVSNAKSSVLASTYQITGTVTVGNIVKNYDFVVENNSDPLELIANALETDRISKEDALDLYLEVLTSGYDIGFCATPIIVLLMPFYEDTAFFSQLSPTKQEALLAMVAPPTPTTRLTYNTPSGRFAITHEGSTTSPTLIVAIGAALEASYSLFVSSSTFQFTAPVSSIGSTVYNVTITSSYYMSDPRVLGGCSSVSNGTSQITFYNIPASTLGNNISPMLQTVIAHEYMHAIMNTYQFIGNTPHWYNEAFASWAMIRQYGTTGSQELAGHVNNFLNSTGLPLSSFSQTWRNSEAYGAVLIPLYIHQYYGGDSTIKGILTRSASSTNVYTNITNALPGSVTFADAFGWSWAGSYAPRYTYTNSITAWNAKPNIYNYYNYMNKFAYGDGPYVVDALSSHFLEFSIVGSTVNITVELDYASSNLKCYFSLRTSAGVINTVDMTGSPSRFYTLVKSSSGYFEGCVIPVNAALSGTTSYELTVYQY